MTVDLETTPVYFAEEELRVSLYWWQDTVLSWFEAAPRERVKGSLCTPNGAGKSERVVATLVLWWLAMHPQGKVVVTTKSGLQLDTQVCPAIERHQGKFDGWKFIERRIETPTGGMGIFFVTDEIGRAEGHHPIGDPMTGPVLLIVDEAKSVPEEMFQALDRCTYAAILYVSSPGAKSGRFYDSFYRKELGFKTLQIGLKECPHIPKSRIDDIIATYGSKSPYTLSTLEGQFMDADGEARFNEAGLKRLKEMSKAHDKLDARDPLKASIGWLEEGKGLQTPIVWTKDDAGPFWIVEPPIAGCSYIGFGDPATGAQAEGSATRDGCSGGVMRTAYTDPKGVYHPDEPVAFLHGHDFSDVHWDNDVVAESLDILLRFYGDCPINVEANNAGVEVIRLLQMSGRTVCRRRRRDHKHPGKLTEIVGFQTNAASKMEWVGAIASAVREQSVDVRYSPMANQLSTFILDEKGRGQAQAGCHDDHVTGLGLALLAKHWAKMFTQIDAHTVVDQLPGVQHYGREPEGVRGAWS